LFSDYPFYDLKPVVGIPIISDFALPQCKGSLEKSGSGESNVNHWPLMIYLKNWRAVWDAYRSVSMVCLANVLQHLRCQCL